MDSRTFTSSVGHHDLPDDTDDSSASDEKPVKKTSLANLAVLSFGTLGAVYGDLGTSPLYVLNTVFAEVDVTDENLIGAVSCIFWLFTLVVIVKYCLLVLTLGPNGGEGGQIAIYCKLSRTLKNGPLGVVLPGGKEHDDLQILTRSETRDSAVSTPSFLHKNSGFLQHPLFKKVFGDVTLAACFLGCALVMSDGLLTPTTSVLSAIDGIAVAVPSFEKNVMPVSVCVLIGLFLLQYIGIKRISFLFSPIITIWLITIAVVGIINISRHPEVFKALSPAEAIYFLRRQGDVDVLGSVMLSITGCEAMFADVGHFSPLSVQLTLGCFVYPCLMLNYLGQGAYLVDHPQKIANVFFNSMPGGSSGGFYWYVFALSTLATIIASQALILGVFSILKQMMQIDCFPHVKVLHTSAKHAGQIFIPTVNLILMAAVCATCAGFRSSGRVTAAYGLGVSMDLLLTTSLIAATIVVVYRVHWAAALYFLLCFGSLEMCLVIANMKKVPHGAWFTLMVTFIMITFFSMWRWAVVCKVKNDMKERIRFRDLINSDSTPREFVLGQKRDDSPSEPAVTIRIDANRIQKLPRHDDIALLYSNVEPLLRSTSAIPGSFKDLICNFPSLPAVMVFCGVKVASVPHVASSERFLLHPVMGAEGVYKCIIRFGFMDKTLVTTDLLNEMLTIIESHNPTYYRSVVSKLVGSPPLHIFNRQHILGVDIRGDHENKRKLKFIRYLLMSLVQFFRSVIIERFFSPLYSIQSIHSSFVSSHERIMYVGSDVRI